MNDKQTIQNAYYGPEQLKIVRRAFDAAWGCIAGDFGTDAGAIEATRLKLAKIVLSFPNAEIRDAEQISGSSLLIMAIQPALQTRLRSSAADHPPSR